MVDLAVHRARIDSMKSWLMYRRYLGYFLRKFAIRPVYLVPHNLRPADVPVVVPCFNNPTHANNMLTQLRTIGFQKIILVDNASTLPEMHAWLSTLNDKATVIALTRNVGPQRSILEPRVLSLLPDKFCLTDPDLLLNPSLPENFLNDLATLIERYKIGKAGFALDISDWQCMNENLYRIKNKEWKIWEWEKQFWERPIGMSESGDPVYDADIDTTFALYDRKYFNSQNFYRAVRVAGHFTARHLPWYRDSTLPITEQNYYEQAQKFSYYSNSDKTPTANTFRKCH